jgi:3-deoxy-7-phosphoheptulonate synthase
LGYAANPIFGVEKSIVCAIGVPEYDKMEAADQLRGIEGVDDVVFISKPYKFVAKELRPKTIVEVDGLAVGSDEVVVMAGPCTVESESQLMSTAEAVSKAGAKILRGGAYKPSTSPYSFQGLGLPGLELLREAGNRFGLKVITEVMHIRKVEEVCRYADILQIGTRNAQNYDLLREVGLTRKPVLLKRGMTAKLEEWLLAAEYIASAGNERIILCERGIRTFETHTRNTLDLSSIPALNSLTHLPVIVDPSQGTGRRELVPPMSQAAIACGADGLLIEVHPNPDKALKDGFQSITMDSFAQLMPRLSAVAEAVGRRISIPAAV